MSYYSWKRLSLLGAALIFFQGCLLIGLLPPLEGVDEYQHLAYIVFLLEEGRSPVLGVDTVPVSLLRQMREYPLPEHAIRQTSSWGMLGYDRFWRQQGRPVDAAREGGPVALYQAQHPPLYYRVMAPLYRLLLPLGLPATVSLMRIFNLLLLAAASFLFFLGTEEWIPSRESRLFVLLLVACHPLYIGNACRVANDIGAIFFGLGSLFLLLRFVSRTSWLLLPGGAAALALGTWIKSTVLVWAPVWGLAFVLVLIGRERRGRGWRALLAAGTFFLCYAALCFPIFYENWQRFGTLGSLVEYTFPSFQARKAAGLWPVLLEVNWFRELSRFLGRLWLGGWSFVKLPIGLESFFVLTLYLGLGAFLVRWIRWIHAEWRQSRRGLLFPSGLFSSGAVALILAAAVGCMLLGMFYHAVISQATYGTPSTNAWYFLLALPPFFGLIYPLLCFASPGAARGYAASLVLFFLGVEVWGWFFRMILFYTDTTSLSLIWDRLAALHPGFLPPALLPVFLGVVLLLLMRLASVLWQEMRAHPQADL